MNETFFGLENDKKNFRTLFWKKCLKNVKEASLENAKKCQNSKSHLQSQKWKIKKNFASKSKKCVDNVRKK